MEAKRTGVDRVMGVILVLSDKTSCTKRTDSKSTYINLCTEIARSSPHIALTGKRDVGLPLNDGCFNSGPELES